MRLRGVLLIVGSGPDEAELRRLAGPNVRFLGARDDVPALLNAADGFVMTSLIEGSPVSLLEAAATELPCVCTPAGGIAETGVAIVTDDVEGAMRRVMRDAGRLGQQAREIVVERYSMEYGDRSMGSPVPLDVTNRFVLDFAARHGGRVLDYGCGAGRLIVAGRARGVDIFGTDVFYGGSAARAEAEASGLFGEFIRDMSDERIPFDDETFDLVVNNQVMEHVEDLDATVTEIHRVVKPGGSVLSVFPSKDVWREGHIGIPFAHWFSRGSNPRFLWTWALRSAGLGTWKEQAPTPRQWAVDKLDWIDRWTRYRSRQQIFASYDRLFKNELREQDYIAYRLLDHSTPLRRRLAKTTRWPVMASLEVALFRKLAFLVIVSKKANS